MGHRPVSTEAIEGVVRGAGAMAEVKRIERPASASRFGVSPASYPAKPSRSGRRLSMVISSTEGRSGRDAPPGHPCNAGRRATMMDRIQSGRWTPAERFSILAAMSRHDRDRARVCPTITLSLVVVLLVAWTTVSRAETESLNPLQRLAAARGAAALDAVEGARRTYWKAFDPAGLSLLVVEPGRWAVLLNHPKPPAGFQAAGTISRHRFEEEEPE